MRLDGGPAWQGRGNHAGHAAAWLHRVKARCGAWPRAGLSDAALVAMLEALPALARDERRRHEFLASIEVLRARCSGKPWRQALDARLLLVERAKETGGRQVRGDAIALTPRRDSWRADKDDDAVWRMADGRTLARFVADGRAGRGAAWREAARLPRLAGIEMPTKHMNGHAWADAFAGVRQWFDGNDILMAAAGKRPCWRMAIRRIHSAGLRGLFDPVSQTVIVDPRDPDTLAHEVAHWALGHAAGMPAWLAEREVAGLLRTFRPRSRATMTWTDGL